MDGREVRCNLEVEVNAIAALFDEPPKIGWQALPKGNEDQIGPHIALEGLYMGQNVWLRILAESPDRYEHGRNLNVLTLQLEDLW